MPDVIHVPSADFRKEIDRYKHTALSQPVIITHDGRDRTVLISAEEYYRLKRLDNKCPESEDHDVKVIQQAQNVCRNGRL